VYRGRIDSLRRLMDALESELEVVTGLVRARLSADPGYVAVRASPGIGPTPAAVFVAEIADVRRFAGPEQLACRCGPTPKHHESDTHVHRGRITKPRARRPPTGACRTSGPPWPSTLTAGLPVVAAYGRPPVPHLGAILLRDLEDHHISAMFTAIEENNEDIRQSLETAPRRRRGTYLKANEVAEGARRERRKVIGPASQQRLRATLRMALNDAIKKMLISGPNPASIVELESGESQPPELWTAETENRWRETDVVPGSTMVWRPEQCGAFLDAAAGDRLYNLFLMASQMGLRLRRAARASLVWQPVRCRALTHVKVMITLAVLHIVDGRDLWLAGIHPHLLMRGISAAPRVYSPSCPAASSLLSAASLGSRVQLAASAEIRPAASGSARPRPTATPTR
jgi:hypothetical protein